MAESIFPPYYPGAHSRKNFMTNDDTQANPKLAFLKDPDDRLPIHWAVANNRFPIVELLVSNPKFDPDEVVCHSTRYQNFFFFFFCECCGKR